MDVSRAQMANLGNGGVVFHDPLFPWIVQVQMAPDSDRPEVIEMYLCAQDEDPQPITATVLAQLPMRQIAGVAASALAGEGEAQYRMLAQPRPKGSRSWPPDHFDRVSRVATWARATGRPGGAAGAVAEFWDVHYRTARRWIARLR